MVLYMKTGELKANIVETITDWLIKQGIAEPVIVLERAAQSQFGEFTSNAAMRYAKQLQKNPFDIAEELAAFLEQSSIEGLLRAEAVRPGFVNLYFTPAQKAQHVQYIREAEGDFGKNALHQGEKWVIEHTSPNPNKAMHIGHLRLNLIGMGIVRLIQESGAEVIADCVYNDRGIAIAKVMYGYLAHMKKTPELPTDMTYWSDHQAEWFTPEEKDKKPDEFVSDCYVLGEQDFSEDAAVEKQVRQMVVDWEAGDETVWRFWRFILQLAYLGHEKTLARLDSHWDKVWYEHEHYQKGKEYVEQGLANGVFTKLEDGAVLTNLEEAYGLPDTIVLKKDGTSLYITQDIALTDLKKKTYNADKLVWVIGPEQSMAMKQLFAVCEQLGIGKLADFTHVSYGKVDLKKEDGSAVKMSSRAGTVVLADDVVDTVRRVIEARFAEEEKYDSAQRAMMSEKLALAAVKFAFLKPDKNQTITFDIDQAIDVHGDSGMYVMYSYVRTQSILKKAGCKPTHPLTAPAELGAEADLVRTLLYYEDVVKKSVDDLSVHHVAQYLLELCSEFNSWYAKEIILDGSDREAYKLALTEAVGITIQNGLQLLGIETVEEI
jgi:arginyl-tRNA synthetase